MLYDYTQGRPLPPPTHTHRFLLCQQLAASCQISGSLCESQYSLYFEAKVFVIACIRDFCQSSLTPYRYHIIIPVQFLLHEIVLLVCIQCKVIMRSYFSYIKWDLHVKNSHWASNEWFSLCIPGFTLGLCLWRTTFLIWVWALKS